MTTTPRAVDSHAHVFCGDAYPYSPDTLYNCVWGSDWPYVRMDERMDYGPPFTCLTRWLPDAKDRQKVLWDTPARLFGFK